MGDRQQSPPRRRKAGRRRLWQAGRSFADAKRRTQRRPTLSDPIELSAQAKRDNVIRLAFGGRVELFQEFCRAIEDFIPPGTTVVMRGSAVTGCRWKDGAPF